MSSTNRGKDRHISDYYVTDINVIVKFLKEFDRETSFFSAPPSKLCLDPCAGGDLKNLMSYPEALKRAFPSSFSVLTIDERTDSLAEIKTDYLNYKCQDNFDLIITNPPFGLAIEIIQKALNDVKENGWVIMLERLNFLGSNSRKPFFDKFMPQYIFMNSERLGFTQDGKKDSIEYGHFCWQKGNYPKFTKLKII